MRAPLASLPSLPLRYSPPGERAGRPGGVSGVSPGAASKALPPRLLLCLLLLALFFVYAITGLIERREKLRAAQEEKQQARQLSIVLRDEWRNLQLEYNTLTAYDNIAAHAARLGMVFPQIAAGNFKVAPAASLAPLLSASAEGGEGAEGAAAAAAAAAVAGREAGAR